MNNELQLEGISICPGIGTGKVYIAQTIQQVPKYFIDKNEIENEQDRYARAVDEIKKSLHEHVELTHKSPYFNAGQILKIHELMVEDKQFHDAIRRRIEHDYKNAEWAVFEESERILDGLDKSGDEYFQARSEDILDMVSNIISALANSTERQGKLTGKIVYYSAHLYISDVMKAKRDGIQGFITESSALTSHAAILLKSYNIPSVGSVKGLESHIQQRNRIIVDGTSGSVIIHPSSATIKKYTAAIKSLKKSAVKRYSQPLAVKTKNGTPIHLMANIDHDSQIEHVLSSRLEGIGLFRTEFLVLAGGRVPDEEEQFKTYKRVLDSLPARRVVFRTFDLGADKFRSQLEKCRGNNPALGIRGIRRHLILHPEELRIQVRALLRAGYSTAISLVIPLVTTVDEIIEVKKHIELVKKELADSGEDYTSDVRLGVMVEIPAAAIAIEDFLAEVDFINVGTNDLLQYIMAADRDNEAIMDYYGDSKNKSFLYLLKFIIERAKQVNRCEDVSICGEIASDTAYIPLLLGMGYRSLSISPVAAQKIRDIIAAIDLTEND